MELIQSLEWRYASKKMNGLRLPEEKVDRVLQAIQLTPSSMGLQPYTVIVITDLELKGKILPIAFNQSQVVDCSHLLVFAAWMKVSTEQVDEHIHNIAGVRGQSVASLSGFHKNITDFITRHNPQQQFEWAVRQTYIALGTAIAAAAVERIDATPMEGFSTQALDQLLELGPKGLASVTLLPLGYRDEENDWLAKLPKVRRRKEQLFIHH